MTVPTAKSSKKTKPLVPKLRFPEFSGEWEECLFNNIASFSKGKNISKSDIVENGITECIRYGELYTDYGESINKIISRTNLSNDKLVLSKYNDVIIPSSGETQLDIATASCVLKDNVALGGDLNIIRTEQNGLFISYYLNSAKKKKIAALAQGNSVVHLYNSQLRGLKLNLPKLPEQTKIANFLSLVDKKKSLLQQQQTALETYKKGLLQQIFSQQLRFKDDNGADFPDWEEKRLGEIAKLQGGYAFKSTKFKEKGIPIIRISNISNHHNFIEIENLTYYDEVKNDENFTLCKGDLIVAMSGATTGKSSIYSLDVKGYLNQRVGVFRVNDKLLNEFLVQFVFSSKFLNQLKKVLVAGAQPNISSKDIELFKINLPCLAEQTKIANFLSLLDKRIENLQQQVAKTQELKKGLLQQMFP